MLNTKYPILALTSGSLISLGIFFNGLLSSHLPPLQASFFIHLIGFLAAWLLCAFQDRIPASLQQSSVPWWVYSAGLFGAIAVACMGAAVNSPLGISGATGLMMLGQIMYGVFSDQFGLLGSVKRSFTRWDTVQIGFLSIGTYLLIYNQTPGSG